MVAYSFAPMFADRVATLVKRQTVRADRKRHARPGEPMQLFTGMRTKHCRKLVSPDPVCLSVTPIQIEVAEAGAIEWIALDGEQLSAADIEAFALADGFGGNGKSWLTCRERMGRFWTERHGVGPFSGVVIKW